MDFLDKSYELKNVRVVFRSNEVSSTIYIEEFPSYSLPLKKPQVLSVYFYFKGDELFDIIGLFNSIQTLKNEDFETIKDFVLLKCGKIEPKDSCSHSIKEVELFQIKPRSGYKLFLKGKNFFGYSLWTSFFFISEDKQFCLCTDKESAKRLFVILHKNPKCLKNKTYLFLINVFKSRGFHIYE